MFERNPVDNFNAMTVAVEVAMADGRTIVGRAALDSGKPVHHLMNGSGDFVYVETPDGEGDFLPKAAIKGLKIIKPIQPRALHQPATNGDDFDPARVLGVAGDAPWDEVHSAYRQLAKLYHPDRFTGVTLPPEVASYLEAKARQINQAFMIMKKARDGGKA